MSERHSLLRRQLKKHLGDAPDVLPRLDAFLEAVDHAYRESDDDRRMLERAFELCSQEMLEINARLSAAKEEADRANMAKRQFLASVSHELRTPLYAVAGYSEMLEADLRALSRDDLAGQAADIHAAGAHLLELINGLLDLSKVEAGRIELKVSEFDLAGLLDGLAAVIRPLAEANRNRFVLDVPAPPGRLRSDETKVRQVLLNLQGNANKFTTMGTVTLAVRRAAEPEDAGVAFVVRDTGTGISAETRARLFEAFGPTSPSAGRSYAGTGLGLAITREYCRALGGSVEVESELGRGSTFTVRLPAAPPATDSRRA